MNWLKSSLLFSGKKAKRGNFYLCPTNALNVRTAERASMDATV